jgi:hypothetical protein
MGCMVWGLNPSGGKIFYTHPGRCWGSPSPYTVGTGAFLGVKLPVCGTDCPLPSSFKVKERVEPYPFSLSGPLWPVLRVNFISNTNKYFLSPRHSFFSLQCVGVFEFLECAYITKTCGWNCYWSSWKLKFLSKQYIVVIHKNKLVFTHSIVLELECLAPLIPELTTKHSSENFQSIFHSNSVFVRCLKLSSPSLF